MVQRTFTLIPKFPGRDGNTDKPPSRPMTSKQVRNAYKAANKGPKLTRAEQWKQEKAEQERIRKEFEREKAAAKAKVVRDKKKEKELAEKEEKRKKRMPLINVRPSQETISWFARGNGSTKKRNIRGKEVEKVNATTKDNNDNMEETTSTNDDETEQPAMKTRKLGDILEDYEEAPYVGDTGTRTKAHEQPLSPSPEQQRIEGPLKETKEVNANEPVEEAPLQAETQMLVPRLPIPEIELEGMEDELDEDFEEDLALGMLEDIEAAMDKPAPNTSHAIDAAPRCSIKFNSAVTQPPVDNIKKPASDRYAKDLGLLRPSSPTFIKPPLPQHSPRNLEARSSSPPRQDPPMSTQAILYNLDDFFPSSSQQARELEEDLDDDDNLMPSAPLHLAPIVEEDEEFEFEELQKSPEQLRLPVLNPAPESPPPPPRRFFTSSGSHERMCLALQRSRRTAALEHIQQRERTRIQAGIVQRAQAENHQVIKPDQSAKKPQVFAKPPSQHIQRNQPRPLPPKTPAPPALQQKPHTNKPSPPKRAEAPKQLYQHPSRITFAPHNNDSLNTPKRVELLEQTVPVQRPSQETKENQRPSQEPFALSASQESYGGDWVDDIALELMI